VPSIKVLSEEKKILEENNTEEKINSQISPTTPPSRADFDSTFN
jgi:hypothetical protein